MNVSAAHNENDGISLKYSTNTTIMNVSTALNKHDGISLYHSTDTSMTHVSAAFNDYDGIHSHNSTDTYNYTEVSTRNTKNTYIANTASLITLSDSECFISCYIALHQTQPAYQQTLHSIAPV